MTLSEWVCGVRNPRDIPRAVIFHLSGSRWIKVKCECFKFTLEVLYSKNFGEQEGIMVHLYSGWK